MTFLLFLIMNMQMMHVAPQPVTPVLMEYPRQRRNKSDRKRFKRYRR